MSLPSGAGRDAERVLVLAPRGRDAEVVVRVLAQAGIEALSCESIAAVVERLNEGAGVVFVTEESLLDAETVALSAWLARQEPWSDLPLVVLATKQAGRRSAQATGVLEQLGNVVLLERPLNAETLVSAARAGLRSRRRQYESRRHTEEQVKARLEIERLYQAERAALHQAELAQDALSLALDAADLGTFHCPMPLSRIFWNATCKQHFWLPPDAEVDIETFYACIHPEDRERTRAAIAGAIEGGAPYDTEYRTVSPSGEFRWIRAKGRAYWGPDGQPTRFDGITIDISRQKRLEAEREAMMAAERAAREQAEHTSRVKDEFLATLSHELRTPLSAMLGWVYVLRRLVQGSPDLLKGVDAIHRSARSQSRLIDELLDMSRIIAGNLRLERQVMMPLVTVEAVLASLQPVAQAKSLRLELLFDENAGPVLADPERLQQIVTNLMSNAIKFTSQGGCVQVRLQRESQGVWIEVIDDGEGIAADFLPYVFDRFRQADGSTTRRHGGLGLGLAIVRHLVELHDGRVEVHSDGLGHGATFRVWLPCCQVDRMAAAAGSTVAMQEVPRLASRLAGTGAGETLAGLTVVLVDDEAEGRDVVARILLDSGAEVVATSSAEETFAALQQRKADVLISDIGMPIVDGYGLLQQVRALGIHVPAIALTAFARSEDQAKALTAGFSVHLAKPIDPPLLVSAVARVARAAAPSAES